MLTTVALALLCSDPVLAQDDSAIWRRDGEPVRPQAGGFYGGWVTNDLVGPFKGEPGTLGW